MRYIKTEDILPEDVVKLIQQYVDGETIYIPRKAENRLTWGCRTSYKTELRQRNEHIYQEHVSGVTIRVLSKKYHLSEKSIRRILQKR